MMKQKKGFEIDMHTEDKQAEKSIEVFNLKQLYENH